MNNWIEDSDMGIVAATAGAAASCDHIISNNDTGGCTHDGILLSSASSCNVNDNLSWNNTYGIEVYHGNGNSVADNRLDWNKYDGIRIDGASVANTVTGNRCWANGTDGVIYDGIRVNDSDLNVISGNISRNFAGALTQRYGISILGTSDYNTVKGNNCTLNVTAPYSVVGAHNSYDGIVRTAVAADLSGGAVTLVCLHPEQALHLARANLLYTEASSADAGITVEIGKESDRDYYYTGATEINKALWYTKEVTLLKNDVAAGDTVTFYSPGSKTGTGEIILILEYLTGAN
jgi:parallel beta-helix repeat protein